MFFDFHLLTTKMASILVIENFQNCIFMLMIACMYTDTEKYIKPEMTLMC